MKIIIFAGGAGTRLWPLSRRNSPKQFEKLKDDKSTLQLAIERVKGFGNENIYISTNEKYVNLVQDEIPQILSRNIFSEPARRDLAAAVGLTLFRLKQQGQSGPVAILWADHFMDRPDDFVSALKRGEDLIIEDPNRFVFLGEKPRFANHNLGWINLGSQIKDSEHEFLGWKYRPELKKCEEMFESGEWMWNPGYFIFDIDFVLGLYKKFMPEMHEALEGMISDEGKLKSEYPNLESISFDNAILEKIEPEQAVVLKVDMGWSDPGTLYALKETMVETQEDNFIKGEVLTHESKDCFFYNEEGKKIVVGVGLDGIMVINTKDALLVCHKDNVPDIKTVLKEIEGKGLDNYL